MTSTPHRSEDPDAGPDRGADRPPDATAGGDDDEQEMREADTANGERPPDGAQS